MNIVYKEQPPPEQTLIELDRQDPLAPLAAEFHHPEGIVYLDGNSLGLMPKKVKNRIQEVTEQQWGDDLITSWNKHQWIDLPIKTGDRIGKLIGAEQGQVVCCDSISVNLFKVLAVALAMQNGRTEIISTHDNFPTDLYIVQGLQALIGEHNCKLVLVDEENLASALDNDTATLLVTEVNFRTGKRLDIETLTRSAHKNGALVIVDLAHSAGVLPVKLDAWHVDFAVGCTYKYLNAGPGAPAFVYAAGRHHENMQQPLYGWMGHASSFDFDHQYVKAQGIKQMLTGTPAIISMSGVDAALDVYDNVTITDIRNKSMLMTQIFLQRIQRSVHCTQLHCISPVDAAHRGSQLSFEFEHAWGLCQALISKGIIADFRAPNYIRFGFAPLYNSFTQIGIVVSEIEYILNTKKYLLPEFQTKNKVT